MTNKCEICKHDFLSRDNLTSHQMSFACIDILSLESDIYPCLYCTKSIETSSYKTHYESCKNRIDIITSINQYIKQPHQSNMKLSNKYKSLYCNNCMSVFNKTSSLNRHVQNKTCNNKYLKCIWCVYIKDQINGNLFVDKFENKEAYDNHVEICKYKYVVLLILLINGIITDNEALYLGLTDNLIAVANNIIYLIEFDVVEIKSLEKIHPTSLSKLTKINSSNNKLSVTNNGSCKNINNSVSNNVTNNFTNNVTAETILLVLDTQMIITNIDKEKLKGDIVNCYKNHLTRNKNVYIPHELNQYPQFSCDADLNKIHIRLNEYAEIYNTYRNNLLRAQILFKKFPNFKRNCTKDLIINLLKLSRFNENFVENLNIIISSHELDKQRENSIIGIKYLNQNELDIICLSEEQLDVNDIDISNKSHLKTIENVLKNVVIYEYIDEEWIRYGHERFHIIIKNTFNLFELSIKIMMDCGKINVKDDIEFEEYKTCTQVLKKYLSINFFTDFVSYCIIKECSYKSKLSFFMKQMKLMLKNNGQSEIKIKNYPIGECKPIVKNLEKSNEIFNEMWDATSNSFIQKHRIQLTNDIDNTDYNISMVHTDLNEIGHNDMLEIIENESKINEKLKPFPKKEEPIRKRNNTKLVKGNKRTVTTSSSESSPKTKNVKNQKNNANNFSKESHTRLKVYKTKKNNKTPKYHCKKKSSSSSSSITSESE